MYPFLLGGNALGRGQTEGLLCSNPWGVNERRDALIESPVLKDSRTPHAQFDWQVPQVRPQQGKEE